MAAHLAPAARPRPILVVLGILALAALTAIFFLGDGRPAHAATITVNTTDDELNVDGDCSLREAFQAANTDATVDACTAGSGADTIGVPAGTYTLSIAGAGEDANATGDLDITDDLTITGAGQATTIIDGGALDRVFDIPSANTVEIIGVTVQNGSVSGCDLAGFGGGIFNAGILLITQTTVRDSSACVGAGIYGGTLTITRSTVSGNVTTGGQGGGIFSTSLTMTDSSVSDNVSPACGGGVANPPIGIASIAGSTIEGNTAGQCAGILNAGTLTLTNSTIAGNATTSHGGGIRNSTSGTITIVNTTISGNTASIIGGGIHNLGALTLKNSIIANSPTGGDCSGGTTSLGHNLDSDGTCGLAGPGDLSGVAPLLGPLQNNGGPTFTHALLPGSPAIDAGNPACPPPATDQRGVARPQGAACDIGAYEFEPPPTPTLTQTPTPTSTPTPTPIPLACPDFDGDGAVTVRDLVSVARRMGSSEGDRRYSLTHDLNQDGRIDVRDLFIVLRQLGRNC